MTPDENTHKTEKTYHYDAFISYSRKDEVFARKLEKALENYSPPKNLHVPERHLNIFRDEEDMVGTEYRRTIEQLMQESAKLIVLCSPNARQSDYVNDEIRRFVEHNDATNIIPIIIDGIPDNETLPDQESMKAFPEALLDVMEMPLAKDYRGFKINRDRIDRSPFEQAWYGLLSEIYGVSRSEIEERDRKRRARLIAIKTEIAFAFVLFIILSIVLVIRQYTIKRISRSQALATQALDSSQTDPTIGFRLAQEALQVSPTIEAQIALFNIFDSESCFYEQMFEGHFAPVSDASFSPDGKKIVTTSYDMTARLWDTKTGKELRQLEHIEFEHAAFSRDGSQVVTLARRDNNDALLVWDATTGQILKKWDRNEINEQVEREIYRLTGHSPSNWGYISEPVKAVRLEIRDNRVVLHDVKSNTEICQLMGHKDKVSAARISPDGSQIVTASLDGTVLLWRVPVHRQQTYSDSFEEAVPMSTDKRFDYEIKDDALFSVTDTVKKIKVQSQDKDIQIMDLSPGKVLHTLTGHTGTISKMMFSPDGTLLATTCLYGLSAGQFDRTLRIWDIETGQEIHRYTGPTGDPEFRFSADGTRLFINHLGSNEFLTWPVTWQEVLRTVLEDNLRGVPCTLTAVQRKGHGIE